MRRNRKSNRIRFASPVPPAEAVQSHLAMTPAEMLELQQKGVPISSQTVGATYDDGYRTLDFEPPLDQQRGIDIADLWETAQDVRKKVAKGHDVAFGLQKGGD